MKFEKVTAVFFSPTGNVKKVANQIAGLIAEDLGVPVESVDFTLPGAREETRKFGAGDLVVFATCVYAGRVPNKLLPYIQSGFEGGGACAVPVVVFGNRSFDDALMELRNELENNGFHTVAAAAVATSHVFSDSIAPGRPDAEDMKKIENFAHQTAKKLSETEACPAPPAVRGNDPVGPYYTPLGVDGKPTVFMKAKPKTNLDLCVDCGLCAEQCPMGSIEHEPPWDTPGICIKCHACVRECPVEAKYFDDEQFLSHVAMLEKNYTRRAEPEFFL